MSSLISHSHSHSLSSWRPHKHQLLPLPSLEPPSLHKPPPNLQAHFAVIFPHSKSPPSSSASLEILTRNRLFPLFFIITRNPSTFFPHCRRLVARRTAVCWLREWVKASTFLVFLGLCFHSKAFLIVPFHFLVSFSPYVFSGGGVWFPAGNVAAGGGLTSQWTPVTSALYVSWFL